MAADPDDRSGGGRPTPDDPTGDPDNPTEDPDDPTADAAVDPPDPRALQTFYGEAPDLSDIPLATHWPSVPAVDAEAEWNELRSWVEDLQGRFEHLDHHVIPPCWWRHNGHVEALCALRDHEAVSFSESAPASAPLDWLRALRDVTAVLRSWTGELACGATHQEPLARLRLTDTDGWEAHVATDTARRRQAALDSAV